jgi:hypothetical protein
MGVKVWEKEQNLSMSVSGRYSNLCAPSADGNIALVSEEIDESSESVNH